VRSGTFCFGSRRAEGHPAARRHAMRPARAVPRTPVSRPSRRVVSLQVDARPCHGRAHPSTQGQGLAVEPSPPLACGVSRRRRGSVSTPHAVSFASRSRPSCRVAFLLAGAHARDGNRTKRTPAQNRAAICAATPRACWSTVRRRRAAAVLKFSSVIA
jgi:hypothetical protein